MLCVQLMIGYTSLRPTVTFDAERRGMLPALRPASRRWASQAVQYSVVVMALVRTQLGKLAITATRAC